MIKKFFPNALVIITIFGTIYVSSQQLLRLSANDPQIQLATDFARDLANGQGSYPDAKKIDISQSLAPVTIVLDDSQKVLFNNALLDGKAPIPPKGVFDYAKNNPDDRVTWQPKTGVRLALVVKHFDGKQKGYVAVARSLTEVEKRDLQIQHLVGFGLAAALGILLWFSLFRWT